MKDFFPIMNDDTDKGMHFALLAYWVFAFGVMPSWMPLFADGFWDNLPVITWFEIGYHVINAAVIAAMLKGYLEDSFLNVQLDLKRFFLIVGSASAVMLVIAAALYGLFGGTIMNAYPVGEMNVSITSGYLVEQQPIFGTICSSVFMPFAVVGLFYASGFAPVCRRNGWLGYLTVTLVLALPRVLDVLWRGGEELVIFIFLMQLPMHWIACWTYQKADTIWAPVATLSIFNLVTSLIHVIFI